jgi:hypothetical protein
VNIELLIPFPIAYGNNYADIFIKSVKTLSYKSKNT